MHGFLSLAPVLALLLGQAETTETPDGAAEAPPAPQVESAAAPIEAPAEPALHVVPAASPGTSATVPTPAAPTPAAPTPAVRARPAEPARAAEPERAQVARAALAFLDALLAGDAAAVAAASSERFSFDGDVRVGRDEIRRVWRALLADRDPAQRGALLDLEILPAADAVARLGPPPPKLAPLVGQRGTWVAIANVSRRPVVLLVAREGGRWAVVGIE